MGESSPGSFRRWLGNLDPEELAENQGITEAAMAIVSRAVYRAAQSPVLARLDEGQPVLPLSARVRGARRAAAYIQRVGPGDILRVHRDYDSPYRNSTYLEGDGRRIGYLSPPDAPALGPEIDAGTTIRARVDAVEATEDGGTILQLFLTEVTD
jgi:hypothetical protein